MSLTFRLMLLIIIVIIGCKEAPIQYPEGGHDFPTTIADADTNNYFYPYKDSGLTKDSFYDAEEYHLYKAFNEENLSIKPFKETIFRFTYGGWMEHPVVITLTNNEIIIKTGSQVTFAKEDTSRLTITERLHYKLLSRFFPLNDTSYSKWRRKYLDSLIKVYPQLVSSNYYHALLEKVVVPTDPPFTYTIKRIPISPGTFRYLVNKINSSGFWTSPYHIFKVECMMTDGYGFSIEANTGKSYQCVHIEGCDNDTTLLTKACQELVKYAKADDKIQLIWNGKTSRVDTSLFEEQQVDLTPPSQKK